MSELRSPPPPVTVAGAKVLKQLSVHDAEATARLTGRPVVRPNGIACPACGHELIDSNPDYMLTSFPPRTQVTCLTCRWQGTRVAG